ncbi:hypothetical protein JX266_011396 [Neoarthrinium moseri]|nr:hypothetical protein JX266_011396 [Neoarthrinium moseri]
MNKLPLELASIIAVDLDIVSLGSLRQASKLTNSLFSPVFLQYFRSQRVDLTRSGLKRLCGLASSPALRSAVSSLTLVCLYYHNDPWYDQKHLAALQNPSFQDPRAAASEYARLCRRNREWIAEQRDEQNLFMGEDMLCMLADCLRHLKNVRHVSLEASVVHGADLIKVPEEVASLRWRELWTGAIQGYRILLMAIARSGAFLDSLHIYQLTKKCSIPTHEIVEPLSLFSAAERGNFASFAAHLKDFSISLATTTLPVRPRLGTHASWEEMIDLDPYGAFDISHGSNLHASDGHVDALADMEGVARLLQAMPNLESLHIHLCTTVNGILVRGYYQHFLSTIFLGGWVFRRLSQLTLRGLQASQQDLYDILARHIPQLRILGLENITLNSGSWNPVFDLLRCEARSLEKLRLSALWSPDSDGNRMNLAPIDKSRDIDDVADFLDWEEAINGERIWYTRNIKGEEVRGPDGLQFRPMVESFGDPVKASWYVRHRAEYGPL